MPRLLRDAPLNGIWEGSGNVIAPRRPARAGARAGGPAGVPGRVRAARAAPTPGSTRTSTRCRGRWPPLAGEDAQWLARRAVEDLALAFQASLLVRFAPPAVADAFCAGRLGDGARAARTARCPAGVDGAAIVARALAV